MSFGADPADIVIAARPASRVGRQRPHQRVPFGPYYGTAIVTL